MTSSAQVARGGRQVTWTRDAIIEKIRRWVELYDEPPRAADWNPSSAKWANATWRIARYRLGDPETGDPWPSLNAAKAPFGGSLKAAIVAAGFEPNRPGPPSRGSLNGNSLDPDREEMSPRARTAMLAAQSDIKALEQRVESITAQLEKACAARDRVAGERDAARRAHMSAIERTSPTTIKTRTKTKTVRVRVQDNRAIDRLERKLEKLEARLADTDALVRAERDRGAAALRDLRKSRSKVESLTAALSELNRELSTKGREVKDLEDKLVAAEAASRRERVVIRERVVRSASDQEVADARVAVATAEKNANEAEVRAARAEREVRELGALVTGEERRLTASELVELRRGGPSGPTVLARALSELATARKRDNGRLPAALVKVSSAAMRWRDAL